MDVCPKLFIIIKCVLLLFSLLLLFLCLFVCLLNTFILLLYICYNDSSDFQVLVLSFSLILLPSLQPVSPSRAADPADISTARGRYVSGTTHSELHTINTVVVVVVYSLQYSRGHCAR